MASDNAAAAHRKRRAATDVPPADRRPLARPPLTPQEAMAEAVARSRLLAGLLYASGDRVARWPDGAAQIGEGQVDQRSESAGPEAPALLQQLASEAAHLRALAEQLVEQLTLSSEAAALAERLRESAEQIEALLAPWRA